MKAEKFIEIWNSSSCVREVTQRTGYNRAACSDKATKMRKRGLPLKIMKGKKQRRPAPNARGGRRDKMVRLIERLKFLLPEYCPQENLFTSRWINRRFLEEGVLPTGFQDINLLSQTLGLLDYKWEYNGEYYMLKRYRGTAASNELLKHFPNRKRVTKREGAEKGLMYMTEIQLEQNRLNIYWWRLVNVPS